MSEQSEKSMPEEPQESGVQNSPDNIFKVNPEIPWTYKWFKGEFHLGPWGSSTSPFGGNPEKRVKVAIMGKKMHPTRNNGVASVYGTIIEVKTAEDRRFLGSPSWWNLDDLSDEEQGKKKK